MRKGRLGKLGAIAAILAALLSAGETRAQQATGDPLAGENVFKQCAKCHSVGPGAATTNAGPSLNGLIGRRSGTYADFNYSPQFRSARLIWDLPTLARFLKAPKSTVPGTRMLFNGLATTMEIADVIAYLAQFDDTGAIRK